MSADAFTSGRRSKKRAALSGLHGGHVFWTKLGYESRDTSKVLSVRWKIARERLGWTPNRFPVDVRVISVLLIWKFCRLASFATENFARIFF